MIIGYLRGGDGYYLRSDRSPRIEGFLYAHLGPQTTGYLRPYGRYADAVDAGGPPFPTQYAGLRYFLGTVKELCLVALADAPTGNQLRIRKNGTDYVVYFVDTTDPNASQIRVQTATGVKAARLKT